MSSGAYRTLGEFGWSSADTPANQRVAVQSALDSGDPILMPGAGEQVIVDGTVEMRETTRLLGTGQSVLHNVDDAADTLHIRADFCTVSGVKCTGPSTERTGDDIVVGPTTSNGFAIYATIERCETTFANRFGIHAKRFGGLTIIGGRIAGRLAALRWDNEHVDTGDSKIIGVDINADNEVGRGLWWTKGGGLYIGQCKFNQGYNHIRIENNEGNTGSIMLQNNSLEGNTPISIDIMGSQYFNRMHIQDNSIGVLGCAIAVRNFNPMGGSPMPWLHGLMIDGNTIEAGFNGSPLMDIGCCTDPLIGPNRLQGRGTSSVPTGIVTRAECVGGKLDLTGSIITGCSPSYSNAGSSITTI